MAKTPNLVPAQHWIHYITLECRFDSIKTDAIMTAPNECNIFSVRPTKRHCRASWATALHTAIRQVIPVPKLFGDHSTLVGEVFQRLDKRQRIASGSKFVMTAFSGQNRPAAAHACPVEGAVVVFLPIA